MARIVGSELGLHFLHNSPKMVLGPRGYKTFFVLSSTEHEIFSFINVKMPTIVGILTFMSWKNSVIGLSEPEKC